MSTGTWPPFFGAFGVHAYGETHTHAKTVSEPKPPQPPQPTPPTPPQTPQPPQTQHLPPRHPPPNLSRAGCFGRWTLVCDAHLGPTAPNFPTPQNRHDPNKQDPDAVEWWEECFGGDGLESQETVKIGTDVELNDSPYGGNCVCGRATQRSQGN